MLTRRAKAGAQVGPRALVALLLSLALAPAACGSPPPATSSAEGSRGATPCAALPPLTELALPERRPIEAFAAQLEASIGEGDASFLIDRIDAVAMSAPAMKDAPVSDSDRIELASRAREVSRAYGLGILRGLGDGGRYQFLRAAKIGGRPAAIFRTISSAGNFDYHGWLVEPRARPGDFTLVDLHLFVLGQSMSAIIGDVVKAKDGAPRGTARCPRVSLVMKLRRAKDAGDEEAAAALLDEVERLPADDPAKGSILLDRLVEQRRFAEAYEALRSLDQRVGGDPYLWALRGNLLFMENKAELAKAELGRALTADPTLEEGYLGLIGISLKERNYKDTTRWLTAMRDVAGAEIVGLESNAEYGDLVRSPEYAAWKEAGQARGARVAECNSLITVINTFNLRRERQATAIRQAPSDAAAYRTAAKLEEEAALELSKVKVALADLAALSVEYQATLRRLAGALHNVASKLEAGGANPGAQARAPTMGPQAAPNPGAQTRAEESIKLWQAGLEDETAALVRLHKLCQK